MREVYPLFPLIGFEGEENPLLDKGGNASGNGADGDQGTVEVDGRDTARRARARAGRR